MKTIEIIFWVSVSVVFYTYIGYGIVLYILVRIKEALFPRLEKKLPEPLPQVTLLIAAYNEQQEVDRKMKNTLEIDYPADKLNIVWVTDGSTDNTNELLAAYPQVKILFEQARRGKSAAVHSAMSYVSTPIVIFTDANTMVCDQAVNEIVREFSDENVGCVAGEKRVSQHGEHNASATEGVYWKYESFLKDLDYRLYSAVGAAGELFAVRTNLYVGLPTDTLLDDFVMSMKIAQRGHKIAYCKQAYAVEAPSEDIEQESKRKVRIAAGGLQSIVRLAALLNILEYGTLSFQYISHRVLRWSLTPVLLFALLPINVVLVLNYGLSSFYGVILGFQVLFYILAYGGRLSAKKKIKNKYLFVPYYFVFMNACVFKALPYLLSHKGSGVWEKSIRKNG